MRTARAFSAFALVMACVAFFFLAVVERHDARRALQADVRSCANRRVTDVRSNETAAAVWLALQGAAARNPALRPRYERITGAMRWKEPVPPPHECAGRPNAYRDAGLHPFALRDAIHWLDPQVLKDAITDTPVQPTG
jgi:hypothetical protein